MSDIPKRLQEEWHKLPIEAKKRHEFSFIRFAIAKESEEKPVYSSGFYMGGDGEYYYDDGRPFPHPYTAKGVIAICCPIKPRRLSHD